MTAFTRTAQILLILSSMLQPKSSAESLDYADREPQVSLVLDYNSGSTRRQKGGHVYPILCPVHGTGSW